MVKIFISLVILLASSAIISAAEKSPKKDYKCDIIIASDSLKDPDKAEATFQASNNNGSHGGDNFSFTSEPFAVHASVNGKWMNLAWLEDGKMVASTVTLIASPVEHRVVLLYNPNNEDDQLSLGCSKQ